MVNTLAVFALAATSGLGLIIGSLIAMCWVEKRLIKSVHAARTRSAVAAIRRAPAHPVVERRLRNLAQPQGAFAAEYRRQRALLGGRTARGTRKAGVAVMSVVVTMTMFAFAAMSLGGNSHGDPAAIERRPAPRTGPARRPARRSPRRRLTGCGNRRNRTRVTRRS